MNSDYFVYQVKSIWYRLYWAYMLLCCGALIILYILTVPLKQPIPFVDTLSLSLTTVILAGICVTYLTTFYWAVARRSNAFAAMSGGMLFAFCILNAFSATDPSTGAIIYALAWGATAFFCGMFGVTLLLGSIFLTYFVVLIVNQFQIMTLSPIAWGLIIGYLLLGAAAYMFWKGRFIDVQNQRVSQLSGALKSNQQQSEILIQSLSDGVIVVSTDGHITLMNPAAAELTGWPVAEAIGIDIQLVMKLSQENGNEITKDDNPFTLILSKKEPASQTLELTARGDKKRTVSLVLSPVVVPGTTTFVGAVAIIRDVSEARAAEKQRGEFISTASHEMRTPVAAIEGYLALALNEKVSTVDSRARNYLEKAHSSTQHLGKLFQDLLTSSKAEDGRLSSHPSVVEMGAFMQQLSDDLKFAAEKKGLLAEFIVGSSDTAIDATAHDASVAHMVKPLYYVHVDPDRIREVITNLFDNACKYTEQGKITIGLTGDTDVVQMYVRDTGAGIPPEDIPHLGQKFYRVDSSATRTIGGTGLGLFISRKIVELYHGRLWAESTLGKGSTFFINLPRLSTQRATELQAVEGDGSPPAAVSSAA